MTHLADDVLLALAEGDAGGEATRAHLAACATCAPQVAAARAAAAALRCAGPASRSCCPPREALADEPAAAGPWSAAAVAAHLRACPWCRDDVRDLRALLDPAPAGLAHRLVLALRAAAGALAADARGLVELIETTLEPRGALAPVAARGDGPAAPASGAAAGVVVAAPFAGGALEVAAAPAGGRLDLRVAVTGDAPRAWRLALSAGDPLDLVESRSADDRGVVTLGGLEPGRYRLEAYGPQRQAPDVVLDLTLEA